MKVAVSTRRELADTLDEVMNASYGDLIDELHLKRGHSLVKTYLLEAHTSAGADHDQLYGKLRGFFGASGQSGEHTSVLETEEDKLFCVRGTNKREQFMFYVEAADPRFWIVYSLAKSEVSDRQIELLLRANPSLDSAWMPAELLQLIQSFGESRGLGLDFDRRFLDAVGKRKLSEREQELSRDAGVGITKAEHFEYVKMQLWGNGADRIVKALADAGLGNSTNVSKVRLKTRDKETPKLFSLSDVKYDGKITGRGTSFSVYNGLVNEVSKRYANSILQTERKYRLSWEDNGSGGSLVGEPIYFVLGDGISDLSRFCSKLFSGDEPFRLMGRPVRRNSEFFTVSAIDLHINQRIDFELNPNTLSVFLPKNTCGNSILRLYTNLQHYLSSDVRVIDGSGARVFTFQS